MTKLSMLLSLAAISLGAQAVAAAADDVPMFDVSRTCRGETQSVPEAAFKSCLADEQGARETLVSQWRQFAPENRANCTQTETGITGVRSSIELLTCLQMAKDVKSLPKE